MSMRIPMAAVRIYDEMKRRPGARPRASDARDTSLLRAVEVRLAQLVDEYIVTGQRDYAGTTYVFWLEIDREIRAGRFDDLLDRL